MPCSDRSENCAESISHQILRLPNGLDPESINLIEAERCLLPVPNPLQGLRDLEEGVIAAKYKNAEKLIKNFSHFRLKIFTIDLKKLYFS